MASAILDKIRISHAQMFYDLCCGSGSVSIELIRLGHPPDRIVMVDLGVFGMVWKAIGDGSFDIDRMRSVISDIPKDVHEIKGYMERMYESEPRNTIYEYLILQASTIGGKSLGLKNGRWHKGSGFRDYWLPTATSSRRSPVNPMMPMPDTIMERVLTLTKAMRGVEGRCEDVTRTEIREGSIVYIDPPYSGTTEYEHSVDVVTLAKSISAHSICWVSEGRPLSETSFLLSEGAAKGGITGERKKKPHKEWLSCFGSSNTDRRM